MDWTRKWGAASGDPIIASAFAEMRLENLGEDLIATPVFPERHVQLKLDLTPRSWDIVEGALLRPGVEP